MTDTSTEAVKSVAVPLEWDGQTLSAEVAAAEPHLGPRYAILAREDGGFSVRTGRGAGYFDGSRRHESVDDAKAACEAQWQISVRQLVPALLAERDALKAERLECEAYLKPDQPPAERMKQDHEEILGLMKLLQAEKERYEKLKLVVQDVVSTNAINTEERDQYLHERDAAIARAEVAGLWSFCPECGSHEARNETAMHLVCRDCGQDWHRDIDYREVCATNIARLRARAEAAEVGCAEWVKWSQDKGALLAAAEARVARASQMLSHIQEMVSRHEVRSAIALAVQDARAALEDAS